MFGEIYLCDFPFTSGDVSKIRPALLLFDLGRDAVICRVTSSVRVEPLDIELKDWNSAGLLRPSIARLGRIITADRSVFLPRLGVLSASDLELVRSVWNTHMKL